MYQYHKYIRPFRHDIRENIMIGTIPAEIHLYATDDFDVIIDMIPNGNIWTHFEMRLDIEHTDGRKLKHGEVIHSSSLKPASLTAMGSQVIRRNHPESWVICFEIVIVIPTIRPTSYCNQPDMWITVGDSKEKCLYIPKQVFRTLPIHFKRMLREDPHPHFQGLKEEDLGNWELISSTIANHFDQCATFEHDRLFSCGTLHVQNPNCPEVQARSSLFVFNRNFQKMSNVHSLDDYNEILENQNARGNPCFDRPEFCKPVGAKNWLDAIERNLGLTTSFWEFCLPENDWMLRLFLTNGGKYLGYSLVSETKRELCKYNMTLEFKGFIPKKGRKKGATTCTTLKFDISPHGGQAQYSYSSPVLAEWNEIKKIGMDHEWASVTLKFKNKGLKNTDDSVVKFNGINNYIIRADNVEIHINREVLLKHSEYFVHMCNNKFEEDNQDECQLTGDDRDALVLCLKILYGCGAPLTYELLGNLLLVADKYAFVDVVKYLDALMTSLAQKNRLPQKWMENMSKIVDQCSLPGLAAYTAGLREEQSSSVVVEEEGHYELLIRLGIYDKETRKPVVKDNRTPEPFKISFPTLQKPLEIAKRPVENKTESNSAPKKRRLFDNDNQ